MDNKNIKAQYLTDSDKVKALANFAKYAIDNVTDIDLRQRLANFVEGGEFSNELTIEENYSIFCQKTALVLSKQSLF